MPSSLNGTGVTFNDSSTLNSGAIPAANLGTGTPNSGNFLRGDRTWAAIDATPTTAGVLAANSSTGFGVVGSYARCFTHDGSVGLGGTLAGNNLVFVRSNGYADLRPVSGTWRNMGPRAGGFYGFASFFLRVS
jgi:hypothetical protein